MTRPRFLVSGWSLRATAHTFTTLVVGNTVAVAAAPLLLLPAAALVMSVQAAGRSSPSYWLLTGAVLLSGLAAVALLGPLLAIPVGALERIRLRLVSPEPVGSGHRTPPPGLWGWVRTRYTESATWREVACLFALLAATLLVDTIVLVLLLLALVMLAAPLLVGEPGSSIVMGPVEVDTVGGALVMTGLSPLALALVVYVSALVCAGYTALGRALLGGLPEEELRAELDEVAGSRARLVGAFEYERRRIERDLHDGAQQRLVALSMDLGMARLELEEGTEADRLVSSAQRRADELITELRELVRGIHPRVLTDRGLPPALAELADRSPVDVAVAADVPRLPAHVEGTAYFVVAEALNNVYKHTGGGARVRAALEGKGDGVLTVEVTDEGDGGADPSRGSGLTGMRDRVAVMGGTMELSSPEGGPTRIRVEIPCTPHRPIPAQ